MQEGRVIWLTGLSGAGKSTLATQLAKYFAYTHHVEILDGDEIRTNLCSDLGFSEQDRKTNVTRIGYLAKVIQRCGAIAIVASISPYRETREQLKASIPNFTEVYVKCDWETLTQRDPKGLYQKALAGEIENFTGLDAPYEEPTNPDIVIETNLESLETSLTKIIQYLQCGK